MGLGEGSGDGSGGEQPLDFVDRDPNELNDHLKVSWEDVLAEPEGLHSNDCSWRLAIRCFICGKLCCYRLFTLFCSCIFAFLWGCQFGYLASVQIWAITPSLRLWAINCGSAQKFWGTFLQCILAPICETAGLCLSRAHVDYTKVTSPKC